MDANGIATAILSVSTPGVNLGDTAVERTKAREVNEYTAQVVKDHPGRFGFFATLNLPDVNGSIIEATTASTRLKLTASSSWRTPSAPTWATRPSIR